MSLGVVPWCRESVGGGGAKEQLLFSAEVTQPLVLRVIGAVTTDLIMRVDVRTTTITDICLMGTLWVREFAGYTSPTRDSSATKALRLW